MTPADHHHEGPIIFQKLQEAGDTLGKIAVNISTQIDVNSNDRFFLWSDMQNIFPAVDYIADAHAAGSAERILFMVDENYQLYDLFMHHIVCLPAATFLLCCLFGHRLIPLRLQYSQYTLWVHLENSSPVPHVHPINPFLRVRTGIKNYTDLLKDVETKLFFSKDEFLRLSATLQYHYRVLLDSFSQIDANDSSIQREIEKIGELGQEITKLDHTRQKWEQFIRNSLLFRKSYGQLRLPSNQLFLVLPTSLSYLDPLDPMTHTFRLYFLCDNTPHSYWHSNNDPPFHVHLTNNPGYFIDRPQEFLWQYGQHALEVLEMVKNGFNHRHHNVPPLGTFDILKKAEGSVPLHHLSRDNIGQLVEMAIAYIQALHVVNWESRALIGGPSLSEVTSYLHLPDGDQGAGGLFRHHTSDNWTRWFCAEHSWQELSFSDVEDFVKSHGGTLNLQLRTIDIHLISKSQAEDFAQRLTLLERAFEVFIHIAWSSSRNELTEVVQDIAEAGVQVLHVQWIAPHTTSQIPYELNLGRTMLILLHDHPRQGNTYIICSLRLRTMATIGVLFQQPVNESEIDWEGLCDDFIDGFNNNVHARGNKPAVIGHDLEYLNFKLGRHSVMRDISGIDVFDSRRFIWNGRLGVDHGIVYGPSGILVPRTFFHGAWLEQGMLRHLVLDSYQTNDMLQILSLMEINPMLQQIQVPAQENNIFRRIGLIRQNCHHLTYPLELTVAHEHEAILARVVFGSKNGSRIPGNDFQEQESPSIDIVHWCLDHISEQLQDSGTEILNAASQKFPSSLTSFTLDTTLLSEEGLANIQRILWRSNLEHLHIRCVPFKSSLEASIARVLQAIYWPTIKSLVLSGNNINDWLQTWSRNGSLHELVGAWLTPTSFGPCLLSLDVLVCPQSTEALSHFSALAIHHLVYACRLVELRLDNVMFEHGREWDMVMRGIHYSSLRKLSLQNCNAPVTRRFKSVTGRSLKRFRDRVGGWMRRTF